MDMQEVIQYHEKQAAKWRELAGRTIIVPVRQRQQACADFHAAAAYFLRSAKQDTALLDHVEATARASRTGVSVDYVKHVEDAMVTERGFRFMRHHHIGDPCATARDAIRQHMELDAMAKSLDAAGEVQP